MAIYSGCSHYKRVIFHCYVSSPEGNGDLMAVINPLVMEYEWLVGGLEPWNFTFPSIGNTHPN